MNRIIEAACLSARPDVLVEGPTRSVPVTLIESDIREITAGSCESKALGPVVRMLCYGFIMATVEHGSFWQIERSAEIALSRKGSDESRTTTIKMPDGLYEALEKISEKIGVGGVSVSSLIRGVVSCAAEAKRKDVGNE